MTAKTEFVEFSSWRKVNFDRLPGCSQETFTGSTIHTSHMTILETGSLPRLNQHCCVRYQDEGLEEVDRNLG